MFNLNGTTITMTKGDTGALKIICNAAKLADGSTYEWGEDDRAVFTIKSSSGTIVKEKVSNIVNNMFVVVFYNPDTDSLPAGSYYWDVRYVINPYYDDDGKIVNGDQVITPMTPQTLTLLAPVGDV